MSYEEECPLFMSSEDDGNFDLCNYSYIAEIATEVNEETFVLQYDFRLNRITDSGLEEVFCKRLCVKRTWLPHLVRFAFESECGDYAFIVFKDDSAYAIFYDSKGKKGDGRRSIVWPIHLVFYFEDYTARQLEEKVFWLECYYRMNDSLLNIRLDFGKEEMMVEWHCNFLQLPPVKSLAKFCESICSGEVAIKVFDWEGFYFWFDEDADNTYNIYITRSEDIVFARNFLSQSRYKQLAVKLLSNNKVFFLLLDKKTLFIFLMYEDSGIAYVELPVLEVTDVEIKDEGYLLLLDKFDILLNIEDIDACNRFNNLNKRVYFRCILPLLKFVKNGH